VIANLADLVQAIRDLASDHCLNPAYVSREKFRAYHPQGKRKIVQRLWPEAKIILQKDAPEPETTPIPVPPVPDGFRDRRDVDPVAPGFEIHGVSTLVPTPDGVQWIKASRKKETREAALARIMQELPTTIPIREGKIDPPHGDTYPDLVSVYPMGDPHFGMLASSKECGEAWDLQVAERINAAAITDLVTRGPRTETALLVNLGDFFHADNPHGTTTAGTRLDVDGRWAKTLQVGMRSITHMIDRLLEHHPRVIVDCQIGNHDEHSSIMLAIGLQSHYRNEPRCEIPVNPNPFHFYRFGMVLIGTTHGDACKVEALPEIMAHDSPDWSGCEHRHWLIGHVHHMSRKDFRGCTVESFRTLAARDAWHHKAGYRSPRDMQRIVYHKRFGEISRETASAGYLEA
jgi:hypothetical protein